MKRLVEFASKYLRAGRNFVDSGRELADALVKLAPSNDGDSALIGSEYGIRKFTEVFRTHLNLDEVRITQLHESFIAPVRRLLDVEIKEAKMSKQRLERARERYNNSLSQYLQMTKETEQGKVKSMEIELQAL